MKIRNPLIPAIVVGMIGAGILVGVGAQIAISANNDGRTLPASLAPGNPSFAARGFPVQENGSFDCYGDGFITADRGRVTSTLSSSSEDLIGKIVHAPDSSLRVNGDLPNFAPADPAGAIMTSFHGPVHYDESGNLVAGWAVCIPFGS